MNSLAPVHIAICDAHTLFRQSISLLLQSFGNIQIVANAGNGLDLIDQIQHSVNLPDVCILDVNMPQLNGYDTMKRMNHQWPSIKVLILTVYESEQSILKFLTGGANGYILKGCDSKDFQHAIEVINNGEYYYPDGILRKLTLASNDDSLKSQLVVNNSEYIFLSYCCTELAYKEIADQMNLSVRTIENYRDSLFKKLNVRTRIGLVIYAMNSGILPPAKQTG